jgi:hypothetical protein
MHSQHTAVPKYTALNTSAAMDSVCVKFLELTEPRMDFADGGKINVTLCKILVAFFLLRLHFSQMISSFFIWFEVEKRN